MSLQPTDRDDISSSWLAYCHVWQHFKATA